MLSRMLGACRLSVDTFEDVEHDRSATLQALAVVVIVSIASIVGSIVYELLDTTTDDPEIVLALVRGIVLGVASWAVWALLTWMIGSTILKTKETDADWGQLARSIGFAQSPGILNVFAFIPVVGIYIPLVTLIWRFAAMVVAVRQSLDYTSTLRAFFVILIAFIPVAFINAIIFVLLGGGGEAQ